jgi:glycosyl transferase family 25
MDEQLNRLGLTYEFFDAIHGARHPDHPLFSKYDDEKRARLRGSGASLRLAQLGCFASHYLLWEKCALEGDAIIVLEDDAILLPEFMAFCRNAAGFARRYGLVWLQPNRKIPRQAGLALENIGPFTVKKFAKGFAGTTGYLLTPRTARALLDYCSEWVYPVDNTMDRFYDHKVESIGLDPVCVTQDDDFESSINVPDDGSKHSLPDTLRREYTNLKDALARTTHNLAFLLRVKLLSRRQD